MNNLIFPVLCGIALYSAVGLCAASDISDGENMPNVESSIESRDKRSLHHFKHWLHKLNPHRLLDKLFHRHHEDEDRKDTHPNDWDTKPHHGFKDVKPVTTEKPTHFIPKFDYSSIYPGTKWCGAGSIARDVTDLGWKWGPDICCRRHDKCSHSIGAKEQKYGLDNRGLFTWSACDCDREFHTCLKRDKSLDADIIGVAYFNALNNYCIYEDYQEHCTKILFFKKTCKQLTTKPKIWKKKKIAMAYV